VNASFLRIVLEIIFICFDSLLGDCNNSST
jgi:hypothetical protein